LLRLLLVCPVLTTENYLEELFQLIRVSMKAGMQEYSASTSGTLESGLKFLLMTDFPLAEDNFCSFTQTSAMSSGPLSSKKLMQSKFVLKNMKIYHLLLHVALNHIVKLSQCMFAYCVSLMTESLSFV